MCTHGITILFIIFSVVIVLTCLTFHSLVVNKHRIYLLVRNPVKSTKFYKDIPRKVNYLWSFIFLNTVLVSVAWVLLFKHNLYMPMKLVYNVLKKDS